MTPEQLTGIAAVGLTMAMYAVIITRKLAMLETKVEIIWRDVTMAARIAAAQVLHHEDDRWELDDLIDGFFGESLTREQLIAFHRKLVHLDQHGPTEATRWAAGILLAGLRERYQWAVE